jgi:predicted carbohydrate-binding protein with CBM5 and CBM33 domain
MRLIAFSSLVLVMLYITSISLLVEKAFGHGTMETPVSRIYNCFLENPENPKSDACKAAVEEGGTQALYDWKGVNQGNANYMHRDIIPDGKRYECKPFPYSGWCNQSALYYAPGSGIAWTDAWISLD